MDHNEHYSGFYSLLALSGIHYNHIVVIILLDHDMIHQLEKKFLRKQNYANHLRVNTNGVVYVIKCT